MFTPVIFEAARAIEPSGRDELEITDAIQSLIDRGLRVEPHIVNGWWKDTGQLEDILEANRLILEDLDRGIEGELDRLARRGPGRDRGRRAAGALDRPRPAIIGAGCADRRRLHRPLLGDRRGRDDRALRGRALDRARGLGISRPETGWRPA